MLFTQPIFVAFFAVVFIACWSLRRNRQRKLLLLASSYVFYAAWDWRFLFLILASTLIDYGVGLALRGGGSPRRRRWWVLASLATNLGILGFFKYFNFFVSSGAGVLHAVGFSPPEMSLDIILPVGISFFTFQSVSYTIDVYRGDLEPTRNWVDFGLYVSFFPQLVAGPIVRARDFLPQLATRKRLADVPFRSSTALFLVGFLKKACIADNVAPLVDEVFASPESYTLGSIWIAVGFYAVQIYCDFSGYTDMAIAVARMLGYELCVNFNFPYFASSIQDFWRRWHMSLSTWLRDYLYISLGGSRGTQLFRFRNVLITMLLGGLWHGASWNFVVWGGLHGLALGAHSLYRSSRLSASPHLSRLRPLFVLLTFYWVCIAWVFFRATDFDAALTILRGIVGFQATGSLAIDPRLAYWFIPLVLAHWFSSRASVMDRVEPLPYWLCAMGFGVATAIMLLFTPVEYRPFVYFQF